MSQNFTSKFLVIVLFISFNCIYLSSQVIFKDVAVQKGIDHLYGWGTAGGGVSFCDFNGDGWDDITLGTQEGDEIAFYLNDEGKFNRIYLGIDHNGQAKSILWVDYDNDGDKDLYVATFDGYNYLYENIGDLTFQDVTIASGLGNDVHRSFGACWGDYNRDGWLDLYYSERTSPIGNVPFNNNRLFRNNADGTFTDMSEASGASDPDKIPFCSAFLDFNDDKWPDLYTANDKSSGNTLLENLGDGTFGYVGETTFSDNEMDAMCVAVGDYNNDGWQDIYVTNTPSGNILLKNVRDEDNQSNYFEEVAEMSGVGFYNVGWGATFFDANNDGLQDLYVCGMNVGPNGQSGAYYENTGNETFNEPLLGFEGDTSRSFNNAIGDFNNDGYPDIIVQNLEPFKAQLWENSGGNKEWVKVKLQGVLSNRDGIGSKIEIYTDGFYQMYYSHCGIGFLGQNSDVISIGLNDYTSIDTLIVTWPTGHTDKLYDIDSKQILNIIEGSTTNEIHVDEDINIISATEQFSNSGNITLFPNPASDMIYLNGPFEKMKTLSILDNRGNKVMEVNDHFSNPIPVRGLTNGLYILMVENEDGSKSCEKFVISR